MCACLRPHKHTQTNKTQRPLTEYVFIKHLNENNRDAMEEKILSKWKELNKLETMECHKKYIEILKQDENAKDFLIRSFYYCVDLSPKKSDTAKEDVLLGFNDNSMAVINPRKLIIEEIINFEDIVTYGVKNSHFYLLIGSLTNQTKKEYATPQVCLGFLLQNSKNFKNKNVLCVFLRYRQMI